MLIEHAFTLRLWCVLTAAKLSVSELVRLCLVWCAGGSLRDYQVQLEELRSLLWGQAVHFVGGGSGSGSSGGRSSSGRSSDGSGGGSDVAARI